MTPQRRNQGIAALVTLLIAVVLVVIALHSYLRFPPTDDYLRAKAPVADPEAIEVAELEEEDIEEFVKLGDNELATSEEAALEGGLDEIDASGADNQGEDIDPSHPEATDNISTSATNTQSHNRADNPKPQASKTQATPSKEEKARKAKEEEERKRKLAEDQKIKDSQNKVGNQMSQFQGNKNGQGGTTAQTNGAGKPGIKTGTPGGTGKRGRTISPQDKPKFAGTGSVKVRVTVTPAGKVTTAEVIGGSISDKAVREACRKASLKVKYNSVPESEGTQTEVLEWKFE